MPHLTDGQKLLDKVTEAVNSKSRWVFITNRLDGHFHLVSLSLRLILLAELSDRDMDYGCIEYLNLATRENHQLSLLTVAKQEIGREKLVSVVGSLGFNIGNIRQDQDLISLQGPDANLWRILEEISSGKAYIKQNASEN